MNFLLFSDINYTSYKTFPNLTVTDTAYVDTYNVSKDLIASGRDFFLE